MPGQSNHIRGDINRDHRKKKTPEAQAIWNTVKEVSPDVILDLHNFFHSYEYFILKKPIHNFCPACSTNSEIDPEVLRKSYRICKIARIAVEKVGGNPAKINGFWTGIYGRLLMAREDVLHTYYPLTLRIPSATFEAKGGFNFCWKRLNEGKRLHRAAVDAVVKALAKKKLG